MKKLVALIIVLAMVLPSSYSLSIKDIIAKYNFFVSTSQMDLTEYKDFIAYKNKDGINDTLVFELGTSSIKGNFIFAISVFGKNEIITNETSIALNQGNNKVNITYGLIFLPQGRFNYSIKIYNSSYSLKYSKDGIPSQSYLGYDEDFRVAGVKDSKRGNKLEINLTINSTLSGAFESTLFLSYNGSVIAVKENKSIVLSTQDLIFELYNDTIKKTHYSGNFTVVSLKIGKRLIAINSTTSFYDFSDFASKPYIYNVTSRAIDINNNSKYDALQISISSQIIDDGNYTISISLYDLFDNILEIKNETYFLRNGQNTMQLAINGSMIYGKRLSGPFAIRYAGIFEGGALVDAVTNGHTTEAYNFNDFENANLPDLAVNISISDQHHYGISNAAINFTFKNVGSKPAFNVSTEIFDNKTFFMANKSDILGVNSEIRYQLNFTNISDFDISFAVDSQDFVDELNESNNAAKLKVVVNKRPNLENIESLYFNETDRIIINLSAYDPNNDGLLYSINSSRFSKSSNIFEWNTTTKDSGNYTLSASASDGFLNDSKTFTVVIFNAPEKDSDDDGINDSVDNVIGDEGSVNTSTINLTIFLGNSSNLSKLPNDTMRVRFIDNNLTVMEFDLNFSLHKLNLTNLSIEKQLSNATGSLLVKGLRMPEGAAKTLYLDKINSTINSICIKDAEIQAINNISGNCNLNDEFKVECDGTAQSSYACDYNSTLDKYKIQGLKHSGIIQIGYTKPLPESALASSSSTGAGSGASSGGSIVVCISEWQCTDWSGCADGIKKRRCYDKNQCAFPTKKPLEFMGCSISQPKEYQQKIEFPSKLVESDNAGKRAAGNESKPESLSGITGFSVNLAQYKKYPFVVFDFMSITLVIGVMYFGAKGLLRMFSE